VACFYEDTYNDIKLNTTRPCETIHIRRMMSASMSTRTPRAQRLRRMARIILLIPIFAVIFALIQMVALFSSRVIVDEDNVLGFSIAEEKEALPTSTALAFKESLGFFTDIPDKSWQMHKRRFQLTQPNYNDSNAKEFERHSRYSNWFWANHFEPEFTCVSRSVHRTIVMTSIAIHKFTHTY